MGIVEDILNKVKSTYTKVSSTIPNAIKSLKSTTTSLKNSVKTLPNKIQKNVGTIVADKIGTIKDGFEDAVDGLKDLPTNIADGFEDTLTKPDGLLDRVGLVNDDGEIRNIENVKDGAFIVANAKMLQMGDGMKDFVDKVEDGVDAAVRAGSAGLKIAAKTAGNFIKDNTVEAFKLAGDFTKNLVENQLESTGVGPFMKDNWQKIGLGASAAGGAYLFSLVGAPVFATKTAIFAPIQRRKIYGAINGLKKDYGRY